MLRSHPALHINLLFSDPPRRLQQRLVLASAKTELTFPMLGNVNSDYCRPEMRHVAKKLDRTLAIAIFHLAIRRTHPTQRLNPALNTFRHSRPLPTSQL